MSAHGRKRWVCPRCGSGVLAPSRPRRDDVRRFCLKCSQKTGRLVERTCPVLDLKAQKKADAKRRAAARKAAARKAKRDAERERLRPVMESQRRRRAEHRQVERARSRRLKALETPTRLSRHELDAKGYVSVPDPVGGVLLRLGVRALRRNKGTWTLWVPVWAIRLLEVLDGQANGGAIVKWASGDETIRQAAHALAMTDPGAAVRYLLETYPVPLPDEVRNSV